MKIEADGDGGFVDIDGLSVFQCNMCGCWFSECSFDVDDVYWFDVDDPLCVDCLVEMGILSGVDY